MKTLPSLIIAIILCFFVFSSFSESIKKCGETLVISNLDSLESKANNILDTTHFALINGSLISQKNFETFKTSEHKTVQLQAASSNTNQLLIFTLVFTLLQIFSLIVFYISYKKLQIANTKNNELQKLREKFFVILSHDLRSPIIAFQGITSTLNFLVKQKKFDQINNISIQIDSITIQLKNLIQNLLDWGQYQQFNYKINLEYFNFDAFIDEILPLYLHIAETKNIRIVSNFENNLFIYADKNHLQIIIRNLLDNAIKNSATGFDISFSASYQHNKVKIIITNYATVKQENIDIINELFSSEKSWQPGEKNIGLGLILVKEFTQSINAKIKLISNSDCLSFELMIPSKNID